MKTSERAYTLIELLVVVFASMAILTLTFNLALNYSRVQSRYANLVDGLTSVASAIRKYGDAHRWHSGAARGGGSFSRRAGYLNYCGILTVASEITDPRSAFLLSKESLEVGGFLSIGASRGWEQGATLEKIRYRPGKGSRPSDILFSDEDVAGVFVLLERAGDTKDGVATPGEPWSVLLDYETHKVKIDAFRRMCSRSPEFDIVEVVIGNPPQDLKAFLVEYFSEADACSRFVIKKEEDDTGSILVLSFAPNTDHPPPHRIIC